MVSAGAGLGDMALEHLGLALALDVPLFVILTKIDLGAARVQVALEALDAALTAAPHGLRRAPLLVSASRRREHVKTMNYVIFVNIVFDKSTR